MNKNKIFSVGIIGCGLIGGKRARALGSQGNLVACADTDFAKASTLAQAYGAKAFDSWVEFILKNSTSTFCGGTLSEIF